MSEQGYEERMRRDVARELFEESIWVESESWQRAELIVESEMVVEERDRERIKSL